MGKTELKWRLPILPPLISVEGSEEPSHLKDFFQRLYNNVRSGRVRIDKHSESIIYTSLLNAVKYLLDDRLADGIGKGGWGTSDRIYMTSMYVDAEGVQDSITTTVGVVLALRSYATLLTNRETYYEQEFGKSISRSLGNLDEYILFCNRWNPHTGEAGTLKVDREGGAHPAFLYRHTARFLTLWLSYPEYIGRRAKTVECLLNKFDINALSEDKANVADSICAHVAFTEIINKKYEFNSEHILSIPTLINQLEQIIISKYVDEINGWCPPAGISTEACRQPYTLLLLSEMPYAFNSASPYLVELMNEALDSTIKGPWMANGGCGVSRLRNGPPDFSMSCLAASALLRKADLSGEERKFLYGTVDYLISSLSGHSDIVLERLKGKEYSWAVSYFVRDICDYIRGDSRLAR